MSKEKCMFQRFFSDSIRDFMENHHNFIKLLNIKVDKNNH